MTRIAILRCAKLPSFVNWEIPNLEELFEEDRLLIDGFKEQGFQAESVVWNDSSIDWNQFDIALIRSTWDYLDEKEHFLDVLSQIETSSCRLFNPLTAVRWNIDKHYLFDLENWGVPIIPTIRAANLNTEQLARFLADFQTQTLVLKPAIGLGGSHSYRVPVEDLNELLNQLEADEPDNKYLIQPFVDSILREGEWSFIYFNRQLSHVLLKQPAANDYRVQGIYGGTVQLVQPLPGDRVQADAVMASLPFHLLYARLDFLRIGEQLSVMEVELIEPIFSFQLVPDHIKHLVTATRDKFETR